PLGKTVSASLAELAGSLGRRHRRPETQWVLGKRADGQELPRKLMRRLTRFVVYFPLQTQVAAVHSQKSCRIALSRPISHGSCLPALESDWKATYGLRN